MPPRRRTTGLIPTLDPNDALEKLQEGIKAQISRPNIYAYKPHDKQFAFHKSTKHIVLYIGGNRSGKTVGGAVETVYRLTGRHPYKKVPDCPVRGRAVAVDFNYGVDMIMIPQLSQFMPPSYLINGSWEDSYDKEHRVLTLANKSFLEFRSYDQDLEKFAGTSRHFCVDEETEVLSTRGWLKYNEITLNDTILTINPDTLRNEWNKVEGVYKGIESESIIQLKSRNNFNVRVTPEHRWLVYNKKTGKRYFTTTEKLKKSEQLIVKGSSILQTHEEFSDDFVELVGWFITEGTFVNANQVSISQSKTADSYYYSRIHKLLQRLDISFNVYSNQFYIKKESAKILKTLFPDKGLTLEFLNKLSTRQLELLLDVCVMGDGSFIDSGRIRIVENSAHKTAIDGYMALLTLLGYRVHITYNSSNSVQILGKTKNSLRYNYSLVSVDSLDINRVPYKGFVWCPKTKNSSFVARRNGDVFTTGNTWYDEEPPKHIYNECQARLIDTNGDAYLTMTPVEGMSWVFDDIYTPGKNGNNDIEIIEIEMSENPYISKESSRRYLASLDPEERKARERGEFVAMGGKVFKNFSKDIHIIPPVVPPKDWEWYVSLDHGYNNPTAMLWHAVSKDNRIITFAEHYKSEMTVPEHAQIFHLRNAGFERIPDFVVGDPAMSQRSGITGTSIFQEYADRGIYISPANNDVDSGINRMLQYLRGDKPRWQITENCVSLIGEMQKLRWATFNSRKLQYEKNRQEKIHKKDDHACDSARYLFSFMPDLTPSDIDPISLTDNNILNAPRAFRSWDEIIAPANSGAVTVSINKPLEGITNWQTTLAAELYENE